MLQGIHNVGHHGAGGGQLACALAVEHHVAQHIALDQHCIEHIVHAGQLVCLGHQTRLHTGSHAAVLAALHPCDQLDHTAQLFRRFHICRGNGTDAAGGNVLGVDLMAAHQRGQNGDLAAGITAVHIVAGVLRLGVAQLLRDLQRIVKAQIFAHHLGEHEVGGAIHDALHLGDDVCRQTLVHRGNDGRTAAHRSLEQEGTAVLFGKAQQLCAVGGHHLLVGGAYAAAALKAGLYIRIRKAGAADGLHHHLDLRVFQNGIEVLYKQVCIRMV